MTDQQAPLPDRGGIASPPPVPPPLGDGAPTSEERTWGMFAHLFVFLGYIGVPFANWIGPAIPYFMFKDKSRFVRFHALQSFAFQTMIWLMGAMLAIPIILFSLVTAGIGFLLLLPVLLVVWVLTVAYVIYLGVKANNGECVEYVIVGAWAKRKVYQEDWKPI